MENKFYEFKAPTKIIFGWGSISKLPEIVKYFGDNILLVTGKKSLKESGIAKKVLELVNNQNLRITVFDQVEPEPSCDTVNKGVILSNEQGCDVVVGIGGGSAIDVAKAIAAIGNKEGKVEEFMQGKDLIFAGLPFIAIPTTAGTGAEVTGNAVLIDYNKKVKESFRHDFLYAKLAIIDPELTISLPAKITAYSGIDALSQAIESFVSTGANPVSDAMALQSIRLINRSVKVAYKKPKNTAAREDMACGALLSGLALANARMGAVHGIAHPLGLKYLLPHGMLCGMLLPYIMEFNLSYAKDKYAQIAQILGAYIRGVDREKAAQLGIDKIKQLLVELGFPWRLRDIGAKQEDFVEIAKDSMNSGSIKSNPRLVAEEDVINILKKAY